MMESIVAIAYGVLAVVGGILGYTKAGSKMSLISGSVSGVLLILSGLLMRTIGIKGLILATVVTGILLVVFAVRLANTRKFMPAGLMVMTGVGAIAIFINALLRLT
jgi:uncharacterized membrane protein (UPF0136 family)